MLGSQLRSISEVLDLLQRIKLVEEQHSYQLTPNSDPGPHQVVTGVAILGKANAPYTTIPPKERESETTQYQQAWLY
jgi:hypothetical protein